MTGRLIAIATAILLGSSCAHAQIGGMTASAPTAGMGMTSPLGREQLGGRRLRQPEFPWEPPRWQRPA
jgi:hypothetical protein